MRRGMRAAEELVRRTHGADAVLSSAELTDLRIFSSTVARLVAAGTWRRLWRGMYLCASRPPSALDRARAAVKHGSTNSLPAVVTGLAGAAALGMRWVPEHTRVQVLVGADVQRVSTDGVLVRRAGDLVELETWRWGGLDVAHAGRLVVDGARECRGLRDVRGLVLGAVADGWTTPREVLRELDAGAVAGTASTRRAVADALRGAASPPEAEVLDVMTGLGLPFVANAEVVVGDQLVGRLDGYLLGTGVGWEVDSEERHGRSADMSYTLQRHERASRMGLSLNHITPTAFRADPDAFLRRLAKAVAYRRARGLGEPPGLRILRSGPVLGDPRGIRSAFRDEAA